MDRVDDYSSEDSWELDDDEKFIRDLRRVRNNDPRVKLFYWYGDHIHLYDFVMNSGSWEDIGRDISKNTYLEQLRIIDGALNDNILPSLFRGLTRSSSIIELNLRNNNISSEGGLGSLEPFLQNSINLRELNVSNNNIQNEGFNILWRALCGSPIEHLDCIECGITSIEIEAAPNNLRELKLSDNNIQSEGFNRLLRSLRNSSIEDLWCVSCGIESIEIVTVPNNLRVLELSDNNIQSEGFNRLLRSLRDSRIQDLGCGNCSIESIEIDTDSFPRNLMTLDLASNRIDSNGCRGIVKLLQEGDALEELFLHNNLIDDEGVAILVDALKTNTTLNCLFLHSNDGISRNGHILIMKLVNDISSINATLQSNHTLQSIRLTEEMNDDIYHYIRMAATCNRQYTDAAAAGREKVIQTQLHSKRRAALVAIQGVGSQSVYGEIDPLHLPEVLSLVGRRHGQDELYVALKASIAEVLTTVDRKQCIQQCIAYHASIVAEHKKVIAHHTSIVAKHGARHEELNEQLAIMEGDSSALAEQRSTKRRRK